MVQGGFVLCGDARSSLYTAWLWDAEVFFWEQRWEERWCGGRRGKSKRCSSGNFLYDGDQFSLTWTLNSSHSSKCFKSIADKQVDIYHCIYLLRMPSREAIIDFTTKFLKENSTRWEHGAPLPVKLWKASCTCRPTTRSSPPPPALPNLNPANCSYKGENLPPATHQCRPLN